MPWTSRCRLIPRLVVSPVLSQWRQHRLDFDRVPVVGQYHLTLVGLKESTGYASPARSDVTTPISQTQEPLLTGPHWVVARQLKGPSAACRTYAAAASSSRTRNHSPRRSQTTGRFNLPFLLLYCTVIGKLQSKYHITVLPEIPLSPPRNLQAGLAAIGAASPVQITRGRWVVVGWLAT